jgi:hypothetical protein
MIPLESKGCLADRPVRDVRPGRPGRPDPTGLPDRPTREDRPARPGRGMHQMQQNCI